MVVQMRVGFILLMIAGLIACSDTETEKRQAEAEAAPEVVEPQVDEAAAAAEAARLAEQAEKAAKDAARLEEGNAYLHINARKPGVQEMESGLQFEILEQGDGKSPGPASRVVTHYHGTFTNGDTFDSSLERGQPAEFPVNRVIRGWTEALQMMKEGDVWRLVIPSHLAYGERGAGETIPPNSVLIFEVELIEVLD